jgi:hypothetical protein
MGSRIASRERLTAGSLILIYLDDSFKKRKNQNEPDCISSNRVRSHRSESDGRSRTAKHRIDPR